MAQLTNKERIERLKMNIQEMSEGVRKLDTAIRSNSQRTTDQLQQFEETLKAL